MRLNTLKRHMRESMKSLGRNGWMTFASISAVTVTLLLVGVFLVVMFNMNHFAEKIENDVEIRVHIDVAANEQDKQALRAQIEAIPKVKEIRYSSKEQELKNLIKSFGEEGSSFRLFEQDNPLSDVYVVKTEKPTDTIKVAKQIEKLQFVHKVNYGQGQVEKLFSTLKVARNVGIVLIIGLLFTAMFLISNTIKITIFARRREIEIMRLVGATNGFIRWPFFLEGLWLGIIGAIFPIVSILVVYYNIYKFLEPKITVPFIELLPLNPFMWQISLILLIFGACIGVWGSMMSVRRFLKV
ncbi:permease-like cell division protein FtsX [Parageobacillus thermoglucosidasius]|uniref:Cell division protein FtsX n=1 Tax=Parageobacillus thermoglucosidasius TaxID=1426 RepID=A0AAN1D5F3_PARTM|nr:permease-like cell division protein FtsX [Parageobacillus thermoglucosidasius]ALF08731.1 cell division protein FtsX [Parageobacillus thermoglucosidasius]ANZ28815.1 cell division protein FtsX [Parageobacillus thermoglucosidasius]APM79552.1 cell division protein FtsX [Parageobacillus thermoglucosidasius]KJX68336.1 cell division protein FtsX [Parageobacillus thermoglucosidasius]MBY6268780.1 ABC transporter permease [Parageobacillus thermoglucosidasius]